MLVLSRQRDEKLVLVVPPSDQPTVLEVTVADIRGDKVRIGCDAPKSVVIHRKEIYDAILKENRAAGTTGLQHVPR